MATVTSLKPGANVIPGASGFGTRDLLADLPEPVPTREDPVKALQAAKKGSKEEKLKFFWRRAVLAPGFENALERARFLIQEAAFLEEPGGALILADGGSGKTFLMQQLLLDFPRINRRYELKMPLVTVDMRQTPDEKSFLIRMLEQADEKVGRDFSVGELLEKVINALVQVECQGLYVDEAQKLDTVTANRRKEGHKLGPFGELLKEIYTRARVCMILAGTPSLRELVDSDSQYRTRWSGRVELLPFQKGVEFQGVLNALAQSLPLDGVTEVSDPIVAEAIWASTNGNFRQLKDFLCRALSRAIDDGARQILPTHLHAAYQITGDFNKPNPFDGLIK
jgi:hypothetical protein